jgi:hypothetical protein
MYIGSIIRSPGHEVGTNGLLDIYTDLDNQIRQDEMPPQK